LGYSSTRISPNPARWRSKPCAVAVARQNGELVAAGDILIVNKNQGRVMVFKPDEPWRDSLAASASAV